MPYVLNFSLQQMTQSYKKISLQSNTETVLEASKIIEFLSLFLITSPQD